MRRATTLTLMAVVCGSVALTAWAAGPGGGSGTTPTLSAAEETGLVYMREEEKMARDVYTYFNELYNLPIFANIAASEQQHMNAVATLLVRYNVTDPVGDNGPGVFTNETLQALYDQLIAQGSTALEEAFAVGVLIEETDITDLNDALLTVRHNDLRRVYQNLLAGSENHLAAFQSQLVTPTESLTLTTGTVVSTPGTSTTPARLRARMRAGDGTCAVQRGAGRGAMRRFRGGNNGSGTAQCPVGAVRIEGAITAIDAATQQIVVGTTTVVVTDTTIIQQQGQAITFADLAVGQTVAACGVLDGETLVATRVTVKYCGL